MTTYEFTLVLNTPADEFDDAGEKLFEAGCDDGTPVLRLGVVSVGFSREADSLESAITSAIAEVAKAGYRVTRVESEEALTIDRFNRQLQPQH